MNKKESNNLYIKAIKYGIKHGLDEDEIDTHFLLSKLKNEQTKINFNTTRCIRSLCRNLRKV